MPDAPAHLIVESGETKQLSARLHQFDNIHIKKGGTVVIAPRSSRWSIWWVTGDVVLEGKIVGLQFGRSTTAIVDQTPDGKTISHQFENSSLGGDGGHGGTASVPGAGTREGGSGARGTTEYGGGGGSPGGVHIIGPGTKLGSPGQNALDWRGGAPASDGGYGKKGGDGARLARTPNGALLLIYSAGRMSGSGTFDFGGEAGANGSEGDPGDDSNRATRGGGGGGGAAPGGDGGHVILVAGDLDHNTTFAAPGGRGGRGGGAGRPLAGSTAGKLGEDGHEGYLDEYTVAQWQ